jgi:hypothetical protein
MTTTSEPGSASEAKPKKEAFESKLGEGRQRFLAHVIEHGLSNGRRSPEDFIRHFPPAAIMLGLKDQPQLRANILVIATGVRPKIALKKSAESCGGDLQIALDEGETDAETIAQLLDPDDRVRYLQESSLWTFVTEGSFWQTDAKDKTRHTIAAEHIAFMLDRGLKDRLITHKDIVDGISVTKLAELLPRTELEKVISAALKQGSANKPYTEANLLGATPASTLVKHVPLPWIWEHVIVPKIAQAHAYAAKSDAPKAEAKAEAPKAEAPKPEAAKPEAAKAEAKAEAPKAEAPKPEAAKAEAPKVEMPKPQAVAADPSLSIDDDSQEVEIEGVAEPSDGRNSDLDLEVDDILGDIPARVEAKSVPKPARR